MANIRTIDYKGFNSASAGTGPKGWMLWSGSTTVSNQTYSGLGMELMDTSESYLKFTTEGGGDLDIRAKKFFVGTPATQFISGSDGDIEISSSLFHLDPANDSLIIGAGTTINASLSVNSLFVPASTNDSNAKAYISSSGVAKFGGDAAGNYDAEFYPAGAGVSKIAGWDIGPSFLSSSNIILSSSGTIQTSDFQSSLFGTGQGWKIGSDGIAEFEEARIRGTLSTAVFEKDTISAVGGAVIIANATTISGSDILSGADTFSVASSAGFIAGEYIVAKATSSTGFTEETFKVEATGSNLLMVSRSGAIPTMSSGQVLVSKGASGSGFIMLNGSSGDYAPYMQMAVRTGSGIDDLETKVMLGNLGSLASSTTFGDLSGQTGLYTDNVYLKGAISASAGEIAGWGINPGKLTGGNMEMSSSGKISTNTDTSKTRIVIDGSTDPSEIRFFSGSVSKVEFTTDITAPPQVAMTQADSDTETCGGVSSTGISGIQLNHLNSGIVANPGGTRPESLRIVPGHIYLRGSNSSSGAVNTEQLHVRRDITFCANGGSLDPNSITSAARFEYQGSRQDTANFRCAVKGEANATLAGTLAKPTAFYADAYTKGVGPAYSFYGNTGVMYNNGKVGIGVESPTEKLEVSGDMSCSLDLHVGDDIHVADDVVVGGQVQFTRTAEDDVMVINQNHEGLNYIKWHDADSGTNQKCWIGYNASSNIFIIKQQLASDINYFKFQADGVAEFDGMTVTSDRRLKKNIRTLDSSLEKILLLNGVKYAWKSDLNNEDQIGFIAQDVEKVLPEVVNTSKGSPETDESLKFENQKSISYQNIIPVLVEAMKEQQKQIDNLQTQLDALK